MHPITFNSPQLIIPLIIGAAVPFLTHLVLTRWVPAVLRNGLTYAITALGAVVTQVAYKAGENWKTYIIAIFYAWAAMLIAHFTGGPDAVKAKTANFGLGPKQKRVFAAGVEVKETTGPPPPPKSPGKVTKPRQSKLRNPR